MYMYGSSFFFSFFDCGALCVFVHVHAQLQCTCTCMYMYMYTYMCVPEHVLLQFSVELLQICLLVQ